MNKIVNLKTVNTSSGSGHAIVMGLNIPDLKTAGHFIRTAAETFRSQCMCSPPETDVMLITIVTEMPVAAFIAEWKRLATEDKILGFFMSQMKRADVLRGLNAGIALEEGSLLPDM